MKSVKTRKLPDGVYIRGSVQGYPMLFTADTGASRTIVSSRIFESMRPEDKPELTPAAKLVGASGSLISEKGKAIFSLQLGKVKLEMEAIVADIEDDGLLGVDVLQNGEDGPTDLRLSKGVMKINNQEVPIIQKGMNDRIREVTAAGHNIIPAQSEVMVDVHVKGKAYDDFSSENEYTIRPVEKEHPLHMSPTLVDVTQSRTCQVRIVNPFANAITIKQNTVLGTAEPIERFPMSIGHEEDLVGKAPDGRIRRLQPQSEMYRSSLGRRKKRTRTRLKTKSRAGPVNTKSATPITHAVSCEYLVLTAEKTKLVEELKTKGVSCYKLEPYEGDPLPPCVERARMRVLHVSH